MMATPANAENALLSLVEDLVEDRVVEGVADEVLSSVRVDRDQVATTYNEVLTLALRSSPVQQFGVSFGVGWKVSRLAALLVGTSFLALQGASMLGIVKVNWRRLGLIARERLQRVPSMSDHDHTTVMSKMARFCQQHVYITSGFSSGAVLAFLY